VRNAALLSSWIVSVACVRTEDLRLPEIDRAAKTLLIAVEHDERLEVEAFDAARLGPITVSLHRADRVTAIFYARELRNFHLEPGPIAGKIAPDGVPLPSDFLAAYEAADVSGLRAWRPIDQLGAAVRRFRLPGSTWAECLDLGGCALFATSMSCDSCPPPPQPATVRPPVAPSPPVLTPCPDGWSPNANPPSDATACEPPVGTASCAAGAAELLPETGCAPIGAACPRGEWSEALPRGAPVRYVRAGAPAGGDGSIGAPFATISDAIAGATPGSVIAIGRGSFRENIALPPGVALIGACAAATTIAGVVLARAGAGEIRDLAIAETTTTGASIRAIGPATSLALSGVEVRGGRGLGLAAESASEISIRGSALRDNAQGGLFLTGGARADVTRTSFERNGRAQILATAATATLTDVIVRDGPSLGVHAGESARIDIRRAALLSNHGAGIAAIDRARVTLSDGLVRRTLDLGLFRRNVSGALIAADGGRIDVARALVDDNDTHGAIVLDGAELYLLDVIVKDTHRLRQVDLYGDAIVANYASRIEGARIVVLRPEASAILIVGGSIGVFRDVVAQRTVDEPTLTNGGESIVAASATIALSRARIELPIGAGVAAVGNGSPACDLRADAPAYARLEDIEVDGTQPRPPPFESLGYSIYAHCDAHLAIARGRFLRSGSGVLFDIEGMSFMESQFPSVVLEDIAVGGSNNDGIYVGNGNARFQRVSVDHVAARGVVAGNGAVLTASDLSVTEAAFGLVVIDPQPHVAIDTFVFARTSMSGVFFENGDLRLRRGRIADNPVGIQVFPDRPLASLLELVVFENNAVSLLLP
jgi:parallel beta helix pectate lyase-like protein